jgi:hypothetical protein
MKFIAGNFSHANKINLRVITKLFRVPGLISQVHSTRHLLPLVLSPDLLKVIPVFIIFIYFKPYISRYYKYVEGFCQIILLKEISFVIYSTMKCDLKY